MIPADEPFFFNSGGRRLFGIWQDGVPSAGAARPPVAILYCHPFGEEKKSAHRAFVETARCLAAEGAASLRFDMTGCGDSEGRFQDATVERWLEDIVAGWTELRRRAPEARGALVGLRLGAALAATALPTLTGVHRLILWQPVIQGKAEFDAELRRLLIQQMMTQGQARGGRQDLLAAIERGEVELDGYAISPAVYRAVGRLDLTEWRHALAPVARIVQFARPLARVQAFADADPKIPSSIIDLPPIWARTDFIPDAGTGARLAREGVLAGVER